jgi:hypothetical protein
MKVLERDERRMPGESVGAVTRLTHLDEERRNLARHTHALRGRRHGGAGVRVFVRRRPRGRRGRRGRAVHRRHVGRRRRIHPRDAAVRRTGVLRGLTGRPTNRPDPTAHTRPSARRGIPGASARVWTAPGAGGVGAAFGATSVRTTVAVSRDRASTNGARYGLSRRSTSGPKRERTPRDLEVPCIPIRSRPSVAGPKPEAASPLSGPRSPVTPAPDEWLVAAVGSLPGPPRVVRASRQSELLAVFDLRDPVPAEYRAVLATTWRALAEGVPRVYVAPDVDALAAMPEPLVVTGAAARPTTNHAGERLFLHDPPAPPAAPGDVPDGMVGLWPWVSLVLPGLPAAVAVPPSVLAAGLFARGVAGTTYAADPVPGPAPARAPPAAPAAGGCASSPPGGGACCTSTRPRARPATRCGLPARDRRRDDARALVGRGSRRGQPRRVVHPRPARALRGWRARLPRRRRAAGDVPAAGLSGAGRDGAVHRPVLTGGGGRARARED